MSKQANAIDISEFQDPSTFDYQAVKDAGIDTLIIRAGYHTRQDKHVKEHIANAKQYGFKWHLYHYWMNGDNEAEWAVQNAQSLGLTSKQYLFLDMEDKTLPTNWGEQFTQFRQVAGQNFQVGLYCSDSPYKAKFDDDQLRQLGVMRWVASYSYEPKNYDIWQISGAGGGGFGKYTKDVDRDYVANSALNVYAEATKSDEPAEKPFTPPTDLPESIKNIVLQDMVVDGIRGLGCSSDNGVTNRIYWTIFGRKYYQEDGDRIWPFLVDKVKAIQSGSLSVDWNDIQNKPDVALKSDIPDVTGLAKKTDIPAPVDLTSYAKKSDIPKPQDLSDYVTKEELPKEPDLSGYALKKDIPSIDGLAKESELDNYALKKDIPTSIDWDKVTDKPSLALKSDIPSLTGYAKLTDIPSVTGLVKEAELADYAKKKDLPDLSGYATTDKVQSLIDQKSNTINESIVKLSDEIADNNGGGINLLKGTSSELKTYHNVTGWGQPANKNIDLEPGTYTYSVYYGAGGHSRITEVYWQDKDGKGHWEPGNTINYDHSGYSRVTFTLPADYKRGSVRLQPYAYIASMNDKVDVAFGKEKLERGTVATPWSPAPEDFTDKITTNSTAIEQNKAQLKVQADQISSKVSSEDFKTLDNKVNNLQIGGRNYLKDSDKTITGWLQDLGTIPNEVLNSLAGKTITVSCDVEWSNYKHDDSKQNRLGFELDVTDSDSKQHYFCAWKSPSTPNGKERVSAMYTLPAGVTFNVKNNKQSGYVSINGSGKVGHVKIELGNKATDWSPAPEDLLSKSEAEDTYAKKSDIPTSMAWQNITDKPDVATKSDIPTSIDWNSVTNKPDLATSAGLPKDLVHTTDLDKTNQKVSNVESTANQALSAAANGQSIATNAQNEAQSVSERVETLTNQLNLANQVPTITSGTLADLASKNGSHHYEIDFIPSDAPAYNWGMCDVVVGENYAKEVFTDTSTTDVYVRTRKSESWSEWRQVTLWN